MTFNGYYELIKEPMDLNTLEVGVQPSPPRHPAVCCETE